MSAVGPNFPINMTWEHLILLSLSKKRPKNSFQAKGVPANGDWARASWVQRHSIVIFLCDITGVGVLTESARQLLFFACCGFDQTKSVQIYRHGGFASRKLGNISIRTKIFYPHR